MCRTSLGRREETGVSWSVWAVAECSQFFLVFLVYLKVNDVILTLLQDNQNWDLSWHHPVLGYHAPDTTFLSLLHHSNRYTWCGLALDSSFKTEALKGHLSTTSPTAWCMVPDNYTMQLHWLPLPKPPRLLVGANLSAVSTLQSRGEIRPGNVSRAPALASCKPSSWYLSCSALEEQTIWLIFSTLPKNAHPSTLNSCHISTVSSQTITTTVMIMMPIYWVLICTRHHAKLLASIISRNKQCIC